MVNAYVVDGEFVCAFPNQRIVHLALVFEQDRVVEWRAPQVVRNDSGSGGTTHDLVRYADVAQPRGLKQNHKRDCVESSCLLIIIEKTAYEDACCEKIIEPQFINTNFCCVRSEGVETKIRLHSITLLMQIITQTFLACTP